MPGVVPAGGSQVPSVALQVIAEGTLAYRSLADLKLFAVLFT
jgi:hypothetical protein